MQERPPPSTGPSLFGRTALVCVIHIETTIEWTLLDSTINIVHRLILLFVDCQRASTSINVDISILFCLLIGSNPVWIQHSFRPFSFLQDSPLYEPPGVIDIHWENDDNALDYTYSRLPNYSKRQNRLFFKSKKKKEGNIYGSVLLDQRLDI